jgi:hypothetical protein
MKKSSTLTLALTISLTFSCWVIALAQDSPPPKGAITAAEILEKHIAATGGRDALHSLQTIHAYGSFGFPLLNTLGDFHFYYKAPASDVFQLDSISHGQSSIGHNEGAAFSKHSVNGFGTLNGVTLNILEENWLGLIESEFDQRYKPIEVVGLADVDGKRAYALKFVPKFGDPQVRYYDCENFLMVRMDLVQRIRLRKDGPESAYKVETYYSEYRDSGGINFPKKIRATASSGNLVLDIHEVRTNTPVNDSAFRKN